MFHTCSTSYVISENEIKLMSHTIYLLERLKSKTLTASNVGKNMEQQELSFVASGNAKGYRHFEESLAVS